MDTARPDDQIRQFVLKYSLADGKMSIMELSVAGIPGGRFMSPQMVAKNNCFHSEPDYYTCTDFHIGKSISIPMNFCPHNH